MIVVDSNVLAYWLLPSDQTPLAEAVWRKDPHWVAPLLWQSEFRNILTVFMRQNRLTLAEAKRIMGEVERLLRDKAFAVSSLDVLDLAAASNCSAYDCEFVALAQLLGVPLITADRRVLRAFPETAQHLTEFVDS